MTVCTNLGRLPLEIEQSAGAHALMAQMTERTRTALESMASLSDCAVESSDGIVFQLHKSVLAEASVVLRWAQSPLRADAGACSTSMCWQAHFKECEPNRRINCSLLAGEMSVFPTACMAQALSHFVLEADAQIACREMATDLLMESCYKLSETGNDLALLIDSLYCGFCKRPPISEATVETLSELARKYNMTDITSHCGAFIAELQLTPSNLPRWHALAARLDLGTALAHCRSFIANGNNFEELWRCASCPVYDCLKT